MTDRGRYRAGVRTWGELGHARGEGITGVKHTGVAMRAGPPMASCMQHTQEPPQGARGGDTGGGGGGGGGGRGGGGGGRGRWGEGGGGGATGWEKVRERGAQEMGGLSTQ